MSMWPALRQVRMNRGSFGSSPSLLRSDEQIKFHRPQIQGFVVKDRGARLRFDSQSSDRDLWLHVAGDG